MHMSSASTGLGVLVSFLCFRNMASVPPCCHGTSPPHMDVGFVVDEI